MNKISSIYYFLIFVFTFHVGSSAYTQNLKDTLNADELIQMKLKDILELRVFGPAAITTLTEAESPATTTIITKDQINNTPARNIYDLLEVYVPGAYWLVNEEGPHVGFRGLITPQNYNFLLLVNGRNLNNKAYLGAKSELEMWNLQDLERIEVIQGPGSVTYGPGAISAVINLITKTPDEENSLESGISYVSGYQSKGGFVNGNITKGKLKLFSHVSLVSTKGYSPDQFLVKNNIIGRIGKEILLDDQPLPYFADYNNQPQVKAFISSDIGSNFNVWGRYTQQGANWSSNEVKTMIDDQFVNLKGTRDRQLTFNANYQRNLSDKTILNSIVSFDSYDIESIGEKLYDTTNIFHPLNMRQDFSENEIYTKFLLNWIPSSQFEVSTGIEYSHENFTSGWGDPITRMRLGDSRNIVNGPNSEAIRDGNKGSADKSGEVFFIGNGWSTNTYTGFVELNANISKHIKVLASGRMDKNTFTNYLFSPRFAIIGRIKDKNYLKVIAQKSVRMNTAAQMYQHDYNDQKLKHEEIRGMELIFTSYAINNSKFNLSTYINLINLIGYQSDINATDNIGILKLSGFELSYNYNTTKADFILNYNFTKLLDWKVSEGVANQGVSYSDYLVPIASSNTQEMYYMNGHGNSLNNWPNHAFKAVLNYRILSKLSLHLNTHAYFDFKGAKDGIESLLTALKGSVYEEGLITLKNEIYDLGAYKADFRLNGSIGYSFIDGLTGMIEFYNILNVNGNKRYMYDFGNDRITFHQTRFIKEPFVLGFKLQYCLK